MSLTVKCPHPDCSQTTTLTEDVVGQAVSCPHCRRQFIATSSTDTPVENGIQVLKQQARPVADLPTAIGRFLVRARLGEGAFGTVYRAYDPQLDREVALKVPLPGRLEGPQQVERFLREARAAARLRHPHIVPLFEASGQAPHFYLAAAFIHGRTLAAALEETPRGCREAARVARELAEALAYAHGQGIVHRDVKPANVMLDDKGAAHLLDFGLAHRRDGENRLTLEGGVVGTPAYLAPERIAASSADVLPASDQYALGVLFYELLCGRAPFEGPTEVVLFNALHTEPPSPRKFNRALPRDLETMCLKCLAKKPQERYPDCQALADDLRRWLEGEPIQARRLSLPERCWRWCMKEPRLALALAFVLALLLMVAGVLWQSDQQQRQLTADKEVEANRAVAAQKRAEDREAETQRALERVEKAEKDLREQIQQTETAKRKAEEAKRQEKEAKRQEKEAKARTDEANRLANILRAQAAKAKTEATQAKTALDQLAASGGVRGSAAPVQAGNTYTVSFRRGPKQGSQPPLRVWAGGAMTMSQSSTPSVQQFTINQKTGTFSLSFRGQTTGLLPVTASAFQVETALNRLASITLVGGVTVSQTGNAPLGPSSKNKAGPGR
jgi:hypothetical protein